MSQASQSNLFPLAEASTGRDYVVAAIQAPQNAEHFVRWLTDIGFLAGEKTRVVRRGLFAKSSLIVRIGNSSFALRYAEAACIHVRATTPEIHA